MAIDFPYTEAIIIGVGDVLAARSLLGGAGRAD